jgi:hypothetical protein
MKSLRPLSCTLAMALIAATALAADRPTNSSVHAEMGGAQVEKPDAQTASSEDAKPSRANCISRCNTAEVRCGAEVRRSRQECSRNAAVAGRDPLSARGNDYTYFCGYFANPARGCGGGFYAHSCAARFQQRHAQCLDALHGDIAGMRYDCFRAERDAQNMCREELRDCRATCE